MPKRNVIWTVAIVAAGVATVLLTRSGPPPDDPDVTRFGPVVEVYRTLRQHAYRPPDDAKLLRGAAEGLIEGLDEFSSYVPPDRIAAFRARLRGYVTAIGLLTWLRGGDVEIVGSLPGSPAHTADIAPGGRLLAVNGRDPAEMTRQELDLLLQGPAAEPVALDILDRGLRRRSVTLTAGPFRIETVTGLHRKGDGRWEYCLDGPRRVACIRIHEFVPATAERLRQALREIGGPAGLVLDLRDNPGGKLDVGFAIANLFLREGVIFTRIGRHGEPRSFPARPDGTQPPTPMVVLINGRSASAAELVAGAMKLHDRAVLVGSRTRGKGLVQSMLALPHGLGLANVTTAEFFVGADTPIARMPQQESWGVDPHLPLELPPAEESARRRFWADAIVVPGRQIDEPPATATAPSSDATTQPAQPALAADPQLAEAVRLLTSEGEVQEILRQARAERLQREAEGDEKPADGNE